MTPPVVLFDGVCNLCNAAVLFIIRRDPRARFRFASLQSDAARKLIDSLGPGAGGQEPRAESQAPGGPRPAADSVVLIDEGKAFVRSAAALRIVGRLRFPWPMLGVFRLVPPPLRDWAYDVVARHRYRWFGKRDVCMVPTPDLRARFLE